MTEQRLTHEHGSHHVNDELGSVCHPHGNSHDPPCGRPARWPAVGWYDPRSRQTIIWGYSKFSAESIATFKVPTGAALGQLNVGA